MEMSQKYHHDRAGRVAKSHASTDIPNQLRRISVRSRLARLAHDSAHTMDGIGDFRDEVTAQFGDVNARFGEVNARFGEVNVRFGEVNARFGEVNARFDEVNARFDEVTARFDEITARFERIDRRLDESFAAITQQFVEQRAYTDFAYERLDKADQSLSAGITRLERKLDRILALVVESNARRR